MYEKIDLQIKLQNLLNRKLMEYKLVNPNYSLRALARRLEMQSSAVSEILKGKRRVSLKKVELMAKKLLLDPSERAELFFQGTKKIKEINNPQSTLKLNAQQFAAISDWTHYALLSLIKTKGFQSDPQWIAQRLGINVSKVNKVLSTLEEVKLITFNKNGVIKRTREKLNTTEDILDLSIQRSHLNDLEMIKEKLLSIAPAKRDFSSFTLAVDPSLMPEAKEIFRRAQDELDQLMEEHSCKEVYRVCMYFYPLTQI